LLSRRKHGSRRFQARRAQAAVSPGIATPPDETAASHGLPENRSFSKTDFNNFLKGYKSQTLEQQFWIQDGMIEGVAQPGLGAAVYRVLR
jgi:hypothetical protein